MFYKRSSVINLIYSGQELFSYKGLKNDLAYFAKASITKERSFSNLDNRR